MSPCSSNGKYFAEMLIVSQKIWLASRFPYSSCKKSTARTIMFSYANYLVQSAYNILCDFIFYFFKARNQESGSFSPALAMQASHSLRPQCQAHVTNQIKSCSYQWTNSQLIWKKKEPCTCGKILGRKEKVTHLVAHNSELLTTVIKKWIQNEKKEK